MSWADHVLVGAVVVACVALAYLKSVVYLVPAAVGAVLWGTALLIINRRRP